MSARELRRAGRRRVRLGISPASSAEGRTLCDRPILSLATYRASVALEMAPALPLEGIRIPRPPSVQRVGTGHQMRYACPSAAPSAFKQKQTRGSDKEGFRWCHRGTCERWIRGWVAEIKIDPRRCRAGGRGRGGRSGECSNRHRKPQAFKVPFDIGPILRPTTLFSDHGRRAFAVADVSHLRLNHPRLVYV